MFLLDMGEPVRIKALAEQMVRLSGLSLRDSANPGGDIEIVCTGLRPGEKLYEELLIDALEAAIARQDPEAALGVLAALMPEWRRGAQAAAGA